MRNVYGPAIFETSNPNIIRELKRQEKRTIQILALNQRKKKFKVKLKFSALL